MNRGWKRTALVVCALVGGSLTSVSTATPASAATTIDADAAQIITQSGRIVDFYTELGITAADFPVVSADDALVLQDVIDIVTETTPSSRLLPTALPASRPTDCTDTGALVAYARQVAAMNNARDPNAGGLDAETVYMYMSHFFDLPSMCGNPAAYYPDWITNSDRTAYNNYLSVSNKSQLTTSVGSMITSAITLADNPVPAVKNFINGGGPEKLAGGLNLFNRLLAGDTLRQEFPTVVALLDADKTPQEIVDQLRANLSSTWTDSNTLNAIVGTTAALMLPTVGATVFALGTVAVSMQLTGINTLMQVAAYNVLRYTTSSRAASRLMRSMGML